MMASAYVCWKKLILGQTLILLTTSGGYFFLDGFFLGFFLDGFFLDVLVGQKSKVHLVRPILAFRISFGTKITFRPCMKRPPTPTTKYYPGFFIQDTVGFFTTP